MLYSMTGFGSTEVESENFRIKIELRTLNSKYLDLNLKLPRELSDRELELKTFVNKHLKRGKVNLTIELVPLNDDEPTVKINDRLFITYYKKFESLAQQVDANPKDLLRLALHSPDVITTGGPETSVDWVTIQEALKSAIDKCNEFRQQEGHALEGQLRSYVEGIRSGLEEVSQRDPDRIRLIRERIGSNIEEIRDKVSVDQNRFEQELIFYIEKLDITEEKVRLGKHLEYFLEVMTHPESQGKKLGFISQEMGREINTIGAKANDAVIQRAVVQMKDELEKIKEQLLNII